MGKNCNTTRDDSIGIGILGVTGRMGRQLLNAALDDPAFRVIGGAASSRSIGKSSSGIVVQDSESLYANAQILIDFSSQESLTTHVALAKKYRRPLVIGTTGLTEEHRKALQTAALEIPIFYSANFSFGIALLTKWIEGVVEQIGPDYTIEIRETHHVHKKDAPSGTALRLKEACKQEVPIESLRLGEIIGEHTIILRSSYEKIELTHSALSRDVFAKGALRAAAFLVHQPPGLYTSTDVFSCVESSSQRLR